MSKHNHRNKQQSNDSNSATIPVREIEVLAYHIHEERGGTDFDNWLEAERLLKEKNCSAGC